ncbi:hypothetical protein K1719_006827 [Acacia pycnantha]|nr:hypothetical protein K1719_006827 [Acacia pycnantha]
MELIRSTFTTCFFLFLLLSLPYFSTGAKQGLESEIYEIDYRGPETHSSSPPPVHRHATPLSNNRKASMGSATVNKGSMNSNDHTKQEKVERIHG